MGKVTVEAINKELEKQNLGELYRIRDKLIDLIITKEQEIIKGNISSSGNNTLMFNRKIEKTKKEEKKQDATKNYKNSDKG